jgi:tryptophan-rich sensory protein
MSDLRKAYLFIPMISVYLSGMYYPIDDKSGKRVWFRPPGWVFGVVWPILLSLLGYSWFLRPKLTRYYAFLTLVLSTWSILFSFNKAYAFINILTALITTMAMILPAYPQKATLLLVPLGLWLSFASLLNYYSIV